MTSDIGDYVRLLRQRCSWPVMRIASGDLDLPSAQGWDRFTEKLEDEVKTDDRRRKEIIAVLADYHHQLVAHGNRMVQLFELEQAAAATLARRAKRWQPEDSPYLPQYPAPLSSKQLE